MPDVVAKLAPQTHATPKPSPRDAPQASEVQGFNETLARRVSETDANDAQKPTPTQAETAPTDETTAPDAVQETPIENERRPESDEGAEATTPSDEQDATSASSDATGVATPEIPVALEQPVKAIAKPGGGEHETPVIAQATTPEADIVHPAAEITHAPTPTADTEPAVTGDGQKHEPQQGPSVSARERVSSTAQTATTATQPSEVDDAGVAKPVNPEAQTPHPLTDAPENVEKTAVKPAETVTASTQAKQPQSETRTSEPSSPATTGEPAPSQDSQSDANAQGGDERRDDRPGRTPSVVTNSVSETEPQRSQANVAPEPTPAPAEPQAVAPLADVRRAENAKQDLGSPKASAQAIDAPAPAQNESPRPVAARAPQPAAPAGQSEGAGEQPRSLEQATQRTMLASVQRGLNAAMAQRGGEMTIRLAPEALGALRISMSIAQGSVTASFTAETAEAAKLLRGGLDSLRESIESRGLQVDRLRIATAHTAQPTADAGGSKSEHNAARQDDARQDAGDGRSRGRGENPEGREQRGRENAPQSRFQQQWRLALDATA